MWTWTESRQQFTFDATWQYMHKWDEFAAYRDGVHKLQSTSAVDFIGVHGSDPYFIEVKNLCKYRIENKKRLISGELAAEIADNVRDTIAGLVWVMKRGSSTPELAKLLRQIFAVRSKCKVVLWLEEDRQPNPVDRMTLENLIKRRLTWLGPHVMVRSRTDPLPGLAVVGEPVDASI